MKSYKTIWASLALTAALTPALTGCDDDFDYPPVDVPVATIKANTSIAEVKTQYWSDERNYASQIGHKEDGSHIIIAGRVTNNCASGNIYKSLIIQDESAALAISLNNTSMSNSYKVGQEVVIDLTDMYIGKYNGLQQLGEPEPYQDGFEVSFLETDLFEQHAQVNGLTDMSKIDTLVTTMDEIKSFTTGEELATMQSRLIRLNNVKFVGGGSLKFCDPNENTNRTIVDENGNRMTVRMSNYSSFGWQTMPGGTGDLVCILSYYGTGWQLLMRDVTDCIGFTGAGDGGDTPVAQANTTVDKVIAKYWQNDLNYCTEIGKNDAGEDEIVTVRVISDDRSGNINKQLYCQDATGAIMFAIDQSRLYQEYAQGQTINVNLTGLNIGRRQGLLQVGTAGSYNGTPQPDRMDFGTWSNHSSMTGAPDASAIVVATPTIADIAAHPEKWSCQIVKLADVHFAQGGKAAFTENNQNTSRDLLDVQGKSIIVRTSSYASFKDETLPAGTGSVTAIVTYYNTTAQLLLNSSADCAGFDGKEPGGDTPVTPPTGMATFKKVNAITSGKSYVFVHNGQVGTAIKESYSYGRLALQAVTIADGRFSTDAVNAITITAADGAYTLVDAYGRYLGMDSDPSHTSNFQCYNAFQEGCTWTITFEGDKVKAVSVLRPELVIGQTGTFTNIAPAALTASGLNLPEIYEKVD